MITFSDSLTSWGKCEGNTAAMKAHRWTQTWWYKVTGTSGCPVLNTPGKQTGRASSPEHCWKLRKRAENNDNLHKNERQELLLSKLYSPKKQTAQRVKGFLLSHAGDFIKNVNFFLILFFFTKTDLQSWLTSCLQGQVITRGIWGTDINMLPYKNINKLWRLK